MLKPKLYDTLLQFLNCFIYVLFITKSVQNNQILEKNARIASLLQNQSLYCMIDCIMNYNHTTCKQLC